MSTPLLSIIASRHHRIQEYWIAQNGVTNGLDPPSTMTKGLGAPPKVIAAVTAGLICVAATVVVILVVCWRYPFCRTRTFWDHGVKRLLRKIYSYFSGIRQQKQEEKLRLVAGVFTRKASRQETRFVVPQIFIHRHSLCYGSQQVVPYTFELEDYRRGSTSSVSSRKSSLSSRKSSMSGRDSIISFDGRLFWPDSRRGSSSSRKSSDGNLSLLPDDRRGSGSSRSSRKSSDGGLSLINDYDRRGSNSSRKSSDGGLIPFFSDYDRRGSNSSRSSRKSSDAGHSNLSFEGESDYSTEAYDFDDAFRFYGRRVRFRRDSPVDFMAGAMSAAMMAGFQIRRSNSLAEMRRLNLVATPQDTSAGKPRPRMDRRATLSSLVVSSLQALDQTVNPVTPSSYLKKKVKVARRGSIGLPFDTPLLMHDLNLEEMRMPRTMSPVQPVGTLEVHLQFNDAKTSISVTVIKANNLSAVGAPPDELFNPYVKVFLIPGRSSKYKTKIVNKTKNPVFEENFRITDLPPGDFNDESGLEFQVYSYESVTRKPLLGVCSMRLAEIEHLEDGYAELTLLPQTYHKFHQGDLRISGCYQPVAGKMVFNILEAKNLPKVSLMGTINPYVKVEMYLNGIREAKQKTKTKQNVQDPLWHHQCVFEVNRENPKLLGHTFLFSVMHRDRMRGTQLIGQVELGWYSHGEQLDHWCEIMEHPHRPTDNWHPVIKTCKSPS